MTEVAETCPRCGKQRFEGAIDCPFCGIVFSRFEEGGAAATSPGTPTETAAPAQPGPEPAAAADLYAGPDVYAGPAVSDDNDSAPGPAPAGQPATGGGVPPNQYSATEGARRLTRLRHQQDTSRIAEFFRFDLTRSLLVTLVAYLLVQFITADFATVSGDPVQVRQQHDQALNVPPPFQLSDTEGAALWGRLFGKRGLWILNRENPDNGVALFRESTLFGALSQEELREKAYRWFSGVGEDIYVVAAIDTELQGVPARLERLQIQDERAPGGVVATFERAGTPWLLLMMGSDLQLDRTLDHYFPDSRSARALARSRSLDGRTPTVAAQQLWQAANLDVLVFQGLLLFLLLLVAGLVAMVQFCRWLDLEGGYGRCFGAAFLGGLIGVVLIFLASRLLPPTEAFTNDTVSFALFALAQLTGWCIAAGFVLGANLKEALILSFGSGALSGTVLLAACIVLYGI